MKKSIQKLFSKVEIFEKNVILGSTFHGLSLIGYKLVYRR